MGIRRSRISRRGAIASRKFATDSCGCGPKIRADVLIENFRPGTMERFGIPLAGLRRRNPRLITLTVSGMGASGPQREAPGYDFVVQAIGGVMSVTGPEEGPPSKVGVPIVDLTTGMMAANGVLAALYARERTGVGQHIDVSLLETHVAWLGHVASGYLATGQAPERHGNGHATIVPYQTFRASDREFALGVGNDAQWSRLCRTLARPDLESDPRFRTNPDRVGHRAELVRLLTDAFADRPAADWVQRIAAAGIPVGLVRSVPEVLSDPQVVARDMVVQVPHPTIGDLRMVGIPLKFSGTPASIRRPPPLLGEHTEEVRRELDLFPQGSAAP